MRKYLILIILFGFINVSAQQVIDKIVAVVGNSIILNSELKFRTELTAARQKANPKDSKFIRKVLNSMINEKLVYTEAKLDTIQVSDAQINRQLNYQMKYYIKQYGSVKRVEQVYGMSIGRIKRELRSATRKNLMAQMLQAKEFSDVNISRREVESFFTKYKDSLGVVPEKFEIAHIFINPQKGARVREKALKFADALYDSLMHGAKFAELAKKYSEDPGSAAEGGDLGWVKKGVFYPQFEAAAFALKIGQISRPVESPVGFHIIQLLGKRGESIHTRHILIKIKSDKKADLRAIGLLNSIRDSIENHVHSFAYYAKKYSDDKQTAPYGGKLGTFDIGQLDKPMLDLLYKMKVGQISYAKRIDLNNSNYGYQIVLLIKKIPQHRPNLKQDYESIKKLALFNKKEKLYKAWIKKLREKIYWQIRL